MLKELHIQNIVLVESAKLAFGSGFNVLSGESGSGKSAIMHSLDLIGGSRSDASLLRRGEEKGSVEAIFDIDQLPSLLHLLDQCGIDHEIGSDLIVRREISSSGKSRAFINHQSVQLTLLRQVTDLLYDMSGQHANQRLLSLDYHRQCLDLFGDLQDYVLKFSKSWEEENQLRSELDALIQSEAQRAREIEICKREIEEIRESNIREGEEEEAFQEYTRLCNADELAQKSGEINRIFSGEKSGVLPSLNRLKSLLDQLVPLAPSLKDTATAFETAWIELQEVSHTLRNFEIHIEHDPQRADQLNSRLEQLAKLKRKYGSTVEEILSYLKDTEQKLLKLEKADENIEKLQIELEELSKKNNKLSQDITKLRQSTAKKFEKGLVEHLRSLNMSKAEFSVKITPQKRTRYGDDKIEFFLTPNVGESEISLRECASGGELSRTLLSIQVLLAGKEKTPTLIFDEIDANIGGETATVVGQKLVALAKNHQVLCITHFAQVASQATHHLRIAKKEIQGRTHTIIEYLCEDTKKEELDRMMGLLHTRS